MHPIAIPFVGIIVICGLFWQVSLFMHDYNNRQKVKHFYFPKRLRAPFTIGVVFTVGVIFYSLLCLYLQGDIEQALGYVTKVLVFSLLILIKSYIGPTFVTFTLCLITHNLLVNGEFAGLLFLDGLLKFLFSQSNYNDIGYVYLFMITIYAGYSSTTEILEN